MSNFKWISIILKINFCSCT